jgi:hypothetical protein
MKSEHVDAAIRQVTDTVAGRGVGLLIRDPAIDPRCPDSSDLDFVVLADITEMRSERLQFDGGVMADMTWLPWDWVAAAPAAAGRGWVPHRLLSSRVVWDSGRDIKGLRAAIANCMHQPEIQARRIGVFLETGFETVREIGITWDFPPLALFWLHIAHAACLSALADGFHLLCPNIYTRPFDYIDTIESMGHPGLRQRWTQALRLEAELPPLVEQLQRCHTALAQRFPEPQWPASVGEALRSEYRYWLSRDELDFRIRTARELAARGDSAAALFHLRFCAYAVARLPVVHARVLEGGNVSFLRPEKAMLPELRRLAPEILEDLARMLAGPRPLPASELRHSLAQLIDFRDRVFASLRAQGVPVAPLKTWAPYQPAAI